MASIQAPMTISRAAVWQFRASHVMGNESSAMNTVLNAGTGQIYDGTRRFAKCAGFELQLEHRNFANKEKKIDAEAATLMTK